MKGYSVLLASKACRFLGAVNGLLLISASGG